MRFSVRTLLVLKYIVAQGGRVTCAEVIHRCRERGQRISGSFWRDMARSGLLFNSDYGIWEITAKGRSLVEKAEAAWGEP